MSERRGNLIDAKREAPVDEIGLPYRPFLYTLDQIAQLLSLQMQSLTSTYIYFEGRSTGMMSRNLMLARNIAPPDQLPEWRIAERELLRWMKRKGFKHYDRTVLTH